MTDFTIETIDTPDGPFTVLEDADRRVVASGWTADRERILGRIADRQRPHGITIGRVASADAVEAYYEGDTAHVMQVPVHQVGTELFLRGWQRLREIPSGEVLTYTGFAERIDRPSAVRAAASICARNAPALFVPCHRVLRSDGTLGGFAWGLDVKRALLEREAVDTVVPV